MAEGQGFAGVEAALQFREGRARKAIDAAHGEPRRRAKPEGHRFSTHKKARPILGRAVRTPARGALPGIVRLALPFSLVGAVWLMYLLDYSVSITASVGMIALMGVVPADLLLLRIVAPCDEFQRAHFGCGRRLRYETLPSRAHFRHFLVRLHPGVRRGDEGGKQHASPVVQAVSGGGTWTRRWSGATTTKPAGSLRPLPSVGLLAMTIRAPPISGAFRSVLDPGFRRGDGVLGFFQSSRPQDVIRSQ